MGKERKEAREARVERWLVRIDQQVAAAAFLRPT